MNYQGEQVNFSQVSDAQFNWVLGQVGKNTQNLYKIGNDTTYFGTKVTEIDERLARNESNLIKMGNDTTYFGTKVTEIDGRLARNESNLIKMGNDMTQIGADNTTMGNAITRIDNAIKGVLQLIGTTNMAVKTNSDNLVQVGKSINQINEDHENMETKISGKADINHTHSGGGGKDCGWFGEKCWDNPFEKLFPTVPMTAILAAGGLGAYLLLRKK